MLLFGLCLAVAAAAQLPSSGFNLSSALSRRDELSSYFSYLQQFPSLLDQLSKSNNTILAPSNDAFSTYTRSTGVAAHFMDDLGDMLKYHVLQGIHSRATFSASPQFLPTLLLNSTLANVTGGQRVEAVLSAGAVTFYSANKAASNIITPDILFAIPGAFTTTGVIHVIDSVLVPPKDEGIAVAEANLTGFIGLIAGVTASPKVLGALRGASDWTIFAPNTSTINLQSLPQNEAFAYQEYHFVQGEVAYSTLLTNSKSLRTLQGGNVTITVQNGVTYVNAARVLVSDYLISTGVLHLIDSALNPYNPSERPKAQSSSSKPPTRRLSSSSFIGIGVGAAIVLTTVMAIVFIAFRKRNIPSRRHELDAVGPVYRPTELECKNTAIELEGHERILELAVPPSRVD